MDNFQFTGNPKADYFLLGIGWIGAVVSLEAIPIILSSIASIMVIYNQYQIAKNKKKK